MSSLARISTLVTRPASTVLDATAALVALPRRVVTMVIQVEETLAAVNSATARTDALIDRINGIATKAEGAVLAAHKTVGAAAAAIEQASTITATAAPLLASYSEPLRRLEPAVRRLADTTDAHEVDALVKLIDRLPRLVNAMDVPPPSRGRGRPGLTCMLSLRRIRFAYNGAIPDPGTRCRRCDRHPGVLRVFSSRPGIARPEGRPLPDAGRPGRKPGCRYCAPWCAY